MSDFDSLRDDIAGIAESFHGYCVASKRHHELLSEDMAALWNDNAELRDELNALANRLEALTSFVVAGPAEVAAKIVTLREAPDA